MACRASLSQGVSQLSSIYSTIRNLTNHLSRVFVSTRTVRENQATDTFLIWIEFNVDGSEVQELDR